MEEYINKKLSETNFYSVGRNNQLKIYQPFYRPEKIKIGSNITFSQMSYLHVSDNCIDNNNRGYNIEIEDNVRIGPYNRIEAFNYICIKKGVLLGPNVYISDGNHTYGDVNKYIMAQEMIVGDSIVINEGVWIGANSVILGNVIIGMGAVVGANSVVKDVKIPAHSVVSGNPVSLIKIYDYNACEWIKVKDLSEEKINKILNQRKQNGF